MPESILLKRRAFVGAALVGAALPLCAQETFTAKPVRIIVPFGAGGITDVVGRFIGQRLGEELKQSVVIENRPGAGGGIAAQAVASAAPDGYTLLLGTVGTQVVNEMLYKKLAYKPAAFVPVSLVSNSPYMLAVATALPANLTGLKSLAALAKSRPGQLNFGSAGNGSSPHLGIELFKLATQTHIVHIPYKSGADAVAAALSNQVQIVIDAIPVVQPHVKDGKLRSLALASAARNEAVPGLRTSVEQGLPGFQIGSWNALVAPAGTPADKIAVLQAALARVMGHREVLARLTELGIDRLPGGAAAYAAHVKYEREKWSNLVAATGMTLD